MSLNRKIWLAIEVALVGALVGFMYLGSISALARAASQAWHWISG